VSGGVGLARLKRVVLERLMQYYRFLNRKTASRPLKTITSAQIAEALDVDPTQVRKDFGAIGLVGIGRVGYQVEEVCCTIRRVLGLDLEKRAVIIGAGRLGGALLAYGGFDKYGLRILGIFDNDPRKIGRKLEGYTIEPVRTLKPFIRKYDIELAILATPVEVAQTLADRVVSAGVKAIWNFAPTRLTVPETVLVRNEHISLGLAKITYFLRQEHDSRE